MVHTLASCVPALTAHDASTEWVQPQKVAEDFPTPLRYGRPPAGGGRDG